MTKITQEKFLEMIKGDKEMAKRLADYLGDEKDQAKATKKTIEFAKKEGYELEFKVTLDSDELSNASGGATGWSQQNTDTLLQGFFSALGIGLQALGQNKQSQQQQWQQGRQSSVPSYLQNRKNN